MPGQTWGRTSRARLPPCFCGRRAVSARREESWRGQMRRQPGEMAMVLTDRGEDRGDWLRGVTDFLVRGMSDLEREFPDKVVLHVETTED